MLKPREIRRLRTVNSQTQEQAAKLADMRTERWSKIEVGKLTNITLDTLDNIAKALKVKPAELLK